MQDSFPFLSQTMWIRCWQTRRIVCRRMGMAMQRLSRPSLQPGQRTPIALKMQASV